MKSVLDILLGEGSLVLVHCITDVKQIKNSELIRSGLKKKMKYIMMTKKGKTE